MVKSRRSRQAEPIQQPTTDDHRPKCFNTRQKYYNLAPLQIVSLPFDQHIMTSLPPELVEEILSHAVQPPNSRTSTIARVSSSFLAICQRLVYSHLHFTSRAQITSFISTYSNPDAGPRVPYCPRMFTVNLSGDESHLVFCDLQLLLSRCFSQGKGDTGSDNEGRLCLDLLRLRLNSHAFDVQIMMIHQALSLVQCAIFWLL